MSARKKNNVRRGDQTPADADQQTRAGELPISPHYGTGSPGGTAGSRGMNSDTYLTASKNERRTSDHRERAYAPRGLRRAAAADWVGLSPTKFDELVRDGLMPSGKLVRGCRLWDRYLLDIAFENLPDEDEGSLAARKAGEAWSDVQ